MLKKHQGGVCVCVWSFQKIEAPLCWGFKIRGVLQVLRNTDTPWVMMGLHPSEPILNGKYRKPKMHLISCTRTPTWQLSLTCLKCAQNTSVSYTWALILNIISKVMAFLFSPEVGHTDGCFVDTMGCESTNSSALKCWQRSAP